MKDEYKVLRKEIARLEQKLVATEAKLFASQVEVRVFKGELRKLLYKKLSDKAHKKADVKPFDWKTSRN